MELAEITLFKNEADLLTERASVYEDELCSSLDSLLLTEIIRGSLESYKIIVTGIKLFLLT